MMNHKRPSVTRLFTPIALAIALAACSTQPTTPKSVDITTVPTQSSQSYMMLADTSQGSLQNDWLIMALKAALKDNNFQQANLLVQRLSKQSLSAKQQVEWQLERAKLRLATGQTKQAYEGLNFQPSWPVTNTQWQSFYQIKAQSLQKLQRYFAASGQLSQLSQYLTGDQQADNNEQIWANLNQYSAEELSTLTTPDPLMQGWLELAQNMHSMQGNLGRLQKSLTQWMTLNPHHPASLSPPAEIEELLALEITQPQHTALLLPLTGKFAKQAQLVRDGFILAMMDDPDRDPQASLTVIDTNTQTAQAIHQQLMQENIDFVVGPLIKDNIEALEKIEQDTQQIIPALALNIPTDIDLSLKTCYLTLSPEQEVAQAAQHLFAQGYREPLILAPKSHYGERVVEAFNKEWLRFGDQAASVKLFGSKRQLQNSINQAFGLTDSQQRIDQINTLLNIPMESQARSRRDIDSVYIVANSSELTLIKPFIEVAVNPDVKPPKLFSNSRSNSGSKQYEDLTGVEYSDIPMLIAPNEQLSNEIQSLWPNSSNTKKRLQALGMDAYTLMTQLPQMKAAPDYVVNGKTGELSLDEQCVVQRKMSWAVHGASN